MAHLVTKYIHKSEYRFCEKMYAIKKYIHKSGYQFYDKMYATLKMYIHVKWVPVL